MTKAAPDYEGIAQAARRIAQAERVEEKAPWVDPLPWIERQEDGSEWRHSKCRFPSAHGCVYEPRTEEQYQKEQA